MLHDSFVRGAFPVGVRTGQLARNGRALPYEVWYPATSRSFGQDLSPITRDRFSVLPNTPQLSQAGVRDAEIEPGQYPLIVFSHTSAGHRRQSTFLTTHLASHGYVVAAVDHTGNTFADLVERSGSGAVMTAEQRDAYIARIIGDRVPDLRLLIDSVLIELSDALDAEKVGAIGWSFGGWAALALPEQDGRVGAVVALAPGGTSKPLPGIIPAQLTFAWSRETPTLLLAAERDRYTLLDGIAELFERTPGPRKHLLVLRHADHDHFGDHIEPELVPTFAAHAFTRSLTLAHLDASLRSDAGALAFLTAEPAAVLRSRGVDAAAIQEMTVR